ncbi:MAG: acetyltransferase [Bacillota bacterium]
MSYPVIVIGGGGHAKVLVDALIIQLFSIKGITEQDENKWGGEMLGVPVIGGDEKVLLYPPDKVQLVNGLGSVKKTRNRRLAYENFKNKGYTFASVIHPSAVISIDVELSEGVQIMAGAIIQAGSRIGENTIINTKASVDHDCIIGNHVHVASGATLSGGVCVGDGVHIGAGATVMQYVSLGKNSVVGAGALVIEDVPEGATVVGVPAKVVPQ